MKITGKIKVLKYMQNEIRIAVEADQFIGQNQFTIPVKDVRFEAESPFEIELKEEKVIVPKKEEPVAKEAKPKKKK